MILMQMVTITHHNDDGDGGANADDANSGGNNDDGTTNGNGIRVSGLYLGSLNYLLQSYFQI